jgi:hypothetical protein
MAKRKLIILLKIIWEMKLTSAALYGVGSPCPEFIGLCFVLLCIFVMPCAECYLLL